MWRIFLLSLSLIAALCPAAGAVASPRETQAHFDVRALGFKVGEMTLTGRRDGGRYETAANFATTGLIRLFRDMGFAMHSSGRYGAGEFRPDSYREEVNTGLRKSSAQMRFVNGTPMLLGGSVRDGDVAPLDPAGQTGTVDPLTALFMVLHDQPAEALCQTDQPVFDGGRRTRVTLTRRSLQGGSVTCAGTFRRVAGYPPDELRKRGSVPLTIRYQRRENGLMQAQAVWLVTIYGQVGLVRRP